MRDSTHHHPHELSQNSQDFMHLIQDDLVDMLHSLEEEDHKRELCSDGMRQLGDVARRDIPFENFKEHTRKLIE